MAKLTKVYNGAYLSTDKDIVVKNLEELYSYLMTKYLEESKAGTTLTKLYSNVTAFLNKKNSLDGSKPKSFESYASLLYDLESDWFTVKYPNIKVSSGDASILNGYLLVVSESNTTYTNLIGPEDVTYVLKLSDNEFKKAKAFFYSKVLVLNTSHLNRFTANIYWSNQSLCDNVGKSLGFVKLVSTKNLEAYKKKAIALLELAKYIKRVLPDAWDAEEQFYMNYYFHYGYDRHLLRSRISSVSLMKPDLSSLDDTGKRYLQLIKDLGHVYEGASLQRFKFRADRLTLKDVLGSEYLKYVQLCRRAGLIPAEFLSFS